MAPVRDKIVRMTKTFAAFTAEKSDDGFRRGVTELTLDDLPEGDVVVDVEWSSVNYKDHLAATEKGRVARISPLVPGIDLAGTVRSSAAAGIGSRATARCCDTATTSASPSTVECAQVKLKCAVGMGRAPARRSQRLARAMAVGTAGYTAALSILALLDHGLTPGAGTVLVTGATGGVGSMAVAMLAGLGFTVAASTGKAGEAAPTFLTAEARRFRDHRPGRSWPTLASRCSRCVGRVRSTRWGVPPSHTCWRRSARRRRLVAASGNVGGADLPTTSCFAPFILRGVTLFGIDSAGTPIDRRREGVGSCLCHRSEAVRGSTRWARSSTCAHVEGALWRRSMLDAAG